MTRRLSLALGMVGALVAGACGGDGGESSQPGPTVIETTTTTVPPTTAAPSTTRARSSTTRTTLRATTTTPRPATTAATSVPVTVSSTTTTTRPLTRSEATQALCRDIETAVRLVSGGNTIGGGVRLTAAVNTYGAVADPTVVAPARRMLSTALSGDLAASAAATQEAAGACNRLGFPISIGMQCVTLPCP